LPFNYLCVKITLIMDQLGKILLIAGGIIILLGLLLIFGQHIPFFGKLPGDIEIRKDNFTFYFPLVTFLILSVILTIILNVIFYFLRK
jgi:membrane protein implicated in regulation of membrane protease activity